MNRQRFKWPALLAIPLLLCAAAWPVAREYRKRAATIKLYEELQSEQVTRKQAEELLSQGADLNARRYTNNVTPLHCAFDANNQVEIVSLFLEHGADINAQTRDGKTALIMAAAEPNVQIVRLLLSRGANVNLRMEEQSAAFTALSYTQRVKTEPCGAGLDVCRDYNEVIRLLKTAGAK